MIPALPASLTERAQWILWSFEFVDNQDEPNKVPYSARRRGRASSTDPLTWSTFERACAVWQRDPWNYDGLGYVFTKEDPHCGLDLDNCLTNTGEVRPWAQGILERFADTYIEVSPRGHGIKIFCKAALLAKGIKFEELPDNGRIEVYTQARFFWRHRRALARSSL